MALYLFRFLFIIFVLLHVQIVRAQVTYSLSHAVSDAISLSADVTAARSLYMQSEEGINQARSYNLPQVTGSSEFGEGEDESEGRQNVNQDGKRYTLSFQLDQNIWSFGRIDARLDAARAGTRVANYQLKAAIGEVAQQVSLAYASFIFRSELVELREDYVDNISAQLKSIERHLVAGTAKRTDVSRVRSQYFQARNDLGLAEARSRSASGTLQRLTGQDLLSGGLVVSRDGLEELLNYVPETFAIALEQVLQSSPVILEAIEELSRVKANARFSEAELYPSIGLRGLASRSKTGDFDSDSTTIGLTGSFSLFDGGLRRSQLRQSRESINSATNLVRSSRDQSSIRVEQIWENLEGHRSGRGDIEDAVSEVSKSVSDAQREVSAGSLSIVALTQSEKDLLDVQILLAENNLQYIQSVIALMREIGILTQLDNL